MLERNVCVPCCLSRLFRTEQHFPQYSRRKTRSCRSTNLPATNHYLRTQVQPALLVAEGEVEEEAAEAVQDVVAEAEAVELEVKGVLALPKREHGRIRIRHRGVITIGRGATTRKWRGVVAVCRFE